MTELQPSIRQLCESERVPGSTGYFKAQEYLCDAITSLGLKAERHDFWDLPMGRCRSIYAESGPSEGPRVLIGAHYDALAKSGPGADDNASAVAVVLRLMALAPKDLPATFVFFDVEENYGFGALHGSTAFSRFYKKPLQQVVVLDLVGGVLAPGLEEFYFQFGNSLPRLKHSHLKFSHLPMKFLEPLGKIFARSDYKAFRLRGIPYSFITSGTPWYYHTQDDSVEILRFEKMEKLIETMNEALFKNTGQKIASVESWEEFHLFIETLISIPELQNDFLKELSQKKTEPSRWELIKMYKQVLPTLRQHGAHLWDPSKLTDSRG